MTCQSVNVRRATVLAFGHRLRGKGWDEAFCFFLSFPLATDVSEGKAGPGSIGMALSWSVWIEARYIQSVCSLAFVNEISFERLLALLISYACQFEGGSPSAGHC